MIASRRRDKAEVIIVRARVRQDNVKDSHLRAGKLALNGSHRRRMVAKQFRAPWSIWRRGSRVVAGWTGGEQDGEPHPSKMEAPTTTEVTLETLLRCMLRVESWLLLLLWQRSLLRLWPSRMYTWVKDFLENPMTIMCSLDMLIMWQSDYGREKYVYIICRWCNFIYFSYVENKLCF